MIMPNICQKIQKIFRKTDFQCEKTEFFNTSKIVTQKTIITCAIHFLPLLPSFLI